MQVLEKKKVIIEILHPIIDSSSIILFVILYPLIRLIWAPIRLQGWLWMNKPEFPISLLFFFFPKIFLLLLLFLIINFLLVSYQKY